MPPNTDFATWRAALAKALAQIADYAPNRLIISLGVDTFETDPISFFKLKSEDFTDLWRGHCITGPSNPVRHGRRV